MVQDKIRKARVLDKYSIHVNDVVVEINISQDEDKPVPDYLVEITNISDATKLILEKIRQEFIQQVDLEAVEKFETSNFTEIQKKFKREISGLISKYFPKIDDATKNMLINYLIEENLGFGKIDVLLSDDNLEEVVINSHEEPVQAYHKRFGWVNTNIKIVTEARIRHFASMIGRGVGKEITTLSPLMDAHLKSGDRVNATLSPISSKGNTITIRKFAKDPWTITKFIEAGTISLQSAAFIWFAIQNEFSILIAGGTGSGKTSMLNVLSNFFPPNQRILSIEDTRELVLPTKLHWVPMATRLPNPEGKGGVSMLDLLVNSLRMRPDRIIVGEIRRSEEARVLFEAMHTGHSVYATIHANNADETIVRLTNPPIDIPKPMVGSIGLVVVQNRNRRSGKRRTLQIAEILPNGDANVIQQLNVNEDILQDLNESQVVYKRLKLYSGMNEREIEEDLAEKEKILEWMLDNKHYDIEIIGLIMSQYYLGILNTETFAEDLKKQGGL